MSDENARTDDQQDGSAVDTGTDQATTAPEVKVGISRQRLTLPSVVLYTMGVIATLVVAYLTYRLLPVILLIFMSLLFATAIEPVVSWLRRGPFNRSAGILLVYTMLFIVIVSIGFLTLPVLFAQVGQLSTSLPATLDDLTRRAQTISSPFIRDQAVAWLRAGAVFIDQFKRPPSASVETAAQTTLSVAEAFFALITFFVVAYYWLTERPVIKRALTSWLSVKRANRVRHVWDDIEYRVGGWVRGQLTLMLIIGLASATGYFVIGVAFWPAMALFIGLCEAIPMVGPYIGTAPAILIALSQPANGGLPALLGVPEMGPVLRAGLVLLFAVILQTIEGNVLVPRVMRNSVGISPLTVIISLLIGASLAGLLGALLAVPIAGSLQVILADFRTAHEVEEKAEAVAEAVQGAGSEGVSVAVTSKAPSVQSPGPPTNQVPGSV